MEDKSKVYIKTDDRNRIIRCEGGYTMGIVDNIDEWVLVDEGNGDRYNLCQSHYFERPLFEEHGIPLYKYVDGECVERTQEEINADIADIPVQAPVRSIEDEVAELKGALLILLSGVTG